MSQASVLLGMARDVLAEFVDVELEADADLMVRASRAQEFFLDLIVRQGNAAYPLPGDTLAAVDVSALDAGGYALPDDFWRLRRARVTYAAAPPALVSMVPEATAHNTPKRIPAAFLMAGKLVLVDGDPETVAARLFGWRGADAVDLWHLTTPAPITADDDELALPDDALQAAAGHLASYMAIKAKAPNPTFAALADRVQEATKGLIDAVMAYGQVPA